MLYTADFVNTTQIMSWYVPVPTAGAVYAGMGTGKLYIVYPCGTLILSCALKLMNC